MLNQIKTLIRLEFANLFGFNILRHTKDKSGKRRGIVLAVVLAVLILVFSVYSALLSYGLAVLGMQDIIPAYLAAIASLLILFFGFFKAGGVIFNRNGYDILSSLPLSPAAVVISRFARMYAEDLVIAAVAVLPGSVVCGICTQAAPGFYLLGLTGILLVPLIPMSIAVFAGALITAAASRMKHKSIVEAGLSVALVLVISAFFSGSGMNGGLDEEMLRELSGTIFSVLEKVYLPAVWLGRAMTENLFSRWLLFALASVLFCAASASAVSLRFHAVCRRLFGTTARHNYRMRSQRQDSLPASLCRRELKRYFSSGIYVANTIMGPVLGTAASAALFAAGVSQIEGMLPFALDVCGIVPVLVAAAFCMMSPSSVSISMEGKNWWIVKSLPLSARSILDAKIMADLAVALPFYLVSEIFLLLALKPGFGDALWVLSAPALGIVFCTVFGITVNLRMPVMNWDSEVSVVKQSASAMLGGLGGALILFVCAAAAGAVPEKYSLVCRLAVVILLSAAALVLYIRNSRADLREIG